MSEVPDRGALADQYLSQLPFPPYPVQEEALLAWFTADQGVLVCAPTGTGKTLIAEAAMFEALHTRKVAYYTTPLIALTEQKFRELQESAVRWGFAAEDVGLVTGNRRVNPNAVVLVVVAEILLNRLLHPEAFGFENVSSVVMDEFHNFADVQRGIVWELSLSLLPSHVRLMLLSATVGNAPEFIAWLKRAHNRELELVEGHERRVPLTYRWVGDQLLNEQLELMAEGDPDVRFTPALVFAFSRDECWSIGEQLKGLRLLGEEQRGPLLEEVNKLNWSQGAGPKLKQMVQRGVGVHHAGLLPKYRRVVEQLYQRKLLAVCVCTETLAAGINLPARSVLITTLMKGPPGDKKVIDASSAHQIFGRAGRPQFDKEGFVFSIAHPDDVQIARWKEKYDQIPEDTKDPGLIKAKKALKKKKPTRRENEQYWNEDQFNKLREAPPGKLYSKGPLPWRLLAYLLARSPDVERIRTVVRKRLMDDPRIKAGERQLNRMLVTLHAGGFVTLDPPPPAPEDEKRDAPSAQAPSSDAAATAAPAESEAAPVLSFGRKVDPVKAAAIAKHLAQKSGEKPKAKPPEPPAKPEYEPKLAHPQAKLHELLVFRSIHPLYGSFLLEHLGTADDKERIQILESVLELPGPVLKFVRVPPPETMPPGPLAAKIDPILISRGLIAPPISSDSDEEEDRDDRFENRFGPPPLAVKLHMLFTAEHPDFTDFRVQGVWSAGEVIEYGGDFNKYVRVKDLTKQEGLIFRHLLRLILLCDEFAEVTPAGLTHEEWRAWLAEFAKKLTAACRSVDPESTDHMIQSAHGADVVEGEADATGRPKEEPGVNDSPDDHWGSLLTQLADVAPAATETSGPETNA